MKKLAITLNPYIKTRYPYMKLKICRQCKHFTVLGDKKCCVCGKNALQRVEDRASSLLMRAMWRTRLIAIAILAVGLTLSGSAMQTGLTAIGGLLVLALLWTMQRRSTPVLLHWQLEQLFQDGAQTLFTGLMKDRERAIQAFHKGDLPLAYEMLREIGAFIQTDQLRMEQILLLQSFVLRKDMDLMLEPLLMDHFQPDLVAYIGELARIRRDLLKEAAFRYVLQHEAQILKMEQGERILISVAGAAVRLKRYITLYPHLVLRYASRLPKDRFLRLYRIMQGGSLASASGLYQEVMQIYAEKYKWDEDFQPAAKK